MPFIPTLPTASSGFNNPTLQQTASNIKVRIPDDCVTCGHQIFVGIFFDGTDNNMDRDKPRGAQTNVVRLYDAYTPDGYQGRYYKIYAPGVGTPFEEIGETEADAKGSPFGKMGAARIYWGICQLMNALHRAVFGPQNLFLSKAQAKQLVQDLLGNDTWEMFDSNEFGKDLLKLRDKMMELRTKIESVSAPKLLQVNLSVFGFSRGAAEARVFCQWLNQIMRLDLAPVGSTPAHAFAGVPVSFDFLGIFDTVASVGIADMLNTGFKTMGGHLGWGQPQFLQIHPSIKKCVHLVAGHEARASFPVDLAGYAGNCEEFVYPGAHSDVGGGYANGDIGIASNNFSRIPLQHMYYAAYQAGVPLLTAKTSPPIPDNVANEFFIEANTAQDFNRYMTAFALMAENRSSAALQSHAHWSLYLSIRNGYTLEPDQASSLYQYNTGLVRQVDQTIQKTAQTSSLMPDPVNRAFVERMAANARVGMPVVGLIASPVIAQWRSNEIEAMDTLATALSFSSQEKWEKLLKSSGLERDLDRAEAGLEGLGDALGIMFKLVEPFTHMAGKHIHDSSAGFIAKMQEYVPHGEYSVNSMGLVRYRRIYNNSGMTESASVHIRPTPFKQTPYYKDLLENAQFSSGGDTSKPSIPTYQHGSPVPTNQMTRQRTSS